MSSIELRRGAVEGTSTIEVGLKQVYQIQSGSCKGWRVSPLPHFFDKLECNDDRDNVAVATAIVNRCWGEQIDEAQTSIAAERIEVSGMQRGGERLVVSFFSHQSAPVSLMQRVQRELDEYKPGQFYEVSYRGNKPTQTGMRNWMGALEINVPRAFYHTERQEIAAERERLEAERRDREAAARIANSGGAYFAPYDPEEPSVLRDSSPTPLPEVSSSSLSAPTTPAMSAVSRFTSEERAASRHHKNSVGIMRQPTKFTTHTPRYIDKRSLAERIFDGLLMISPSGLRPSDAN